MNTWDYGWSMNCMFFIGNELWNIHRREGIGNPLEQMIEFQSGSKEILGKRKRKVTTEHKATAEGFTSPLTSN